MTARMRIEKRRSEIRQRLAEIAELEGEALTEAVRTERGELLTELRESEPALQAAIEAEETDERLRGGQAQGQDGEAAALAALESRASCAAYVGAALERRNVDGAELEFNQALRIGPERFPLRLLAPPEERASTDADAQVAPRSWVDRLFAETAAAALGITFDTVESGAAAYPVTTAGAAGAQRGREEAAADAGWTVGVTELKPTRNPVKFTFAVEDAERLPGLEPALIRDGRMALMEAVDLAIFSGDDGANENGADITGLRTAAGVAEKQVTQANKVKGAETLAAFAELVDGKHAGGVEDLAVVAAVAANSLWLTRVINAAASNETLAQFLKASGLMWRVRAGIEDAATNNGKFAAYIGRRRGIQGAAVAAVWESGSLIRDPYSGADKGQVILVLNHLWAFGIPRPSNFARVKFAA